MRDPHEVRGFAVTSRGHLKSAGRTFLSIVGLAALAALFTACDVGGIHPIFPDPVSPNGKNIYDTYVGISILALIVFVGVEAALLWVAIRYRRSRQPAGYVPPQVHGHTGLEIAWTIVPLVIVLAIAGYSFVELQRDFQPISNQQMTVIVSGHQFGWNYDYGGGVVVKQEGNIRGDVQPFVVPTNTLVKLQFRATDVIHSWWVPAISGKTDAVPGYDNFSWLKIDRVGSWRGECAELCGTGHASMQIIVQAMDKGDFDAWLAKQKSSASQSSPKPSGPGPAQTSPSASPSPSK
jgi:cytochrome c oxidase subunit II